MTDKTGTKVTFMPDDTIFDDVIYDYKVLTVRDFVRWLSSQRDLKINLEDKP